MNELNQNVSASEIKVWDVFIRTFHWLLVLGFIITFATEDDLMQLHAWAGYLIGVLIVLRVLWGFIGTEHARFTDFVTPPKQAWSYLKDTFSMRAKRYIGHNPAGGLMVMALLTSLLLAVVSGIALYGIEEHAGPLASMMAGSPKYVENGLEALHEFFANFSLFLVLIHVAGVLVESMLHRENLIRAMIKGYKKSALN